MTSAPGQIISPDEDGDGKYDHNMNCSWTIEAAEGEIIVFNFTQLAIDDSFRCSEDKAGGKLKQTDSKRIAYLDKHLRVHIMKICCAV